MRVSCGVNLNKGNLLMLCSSDESQVWYRNYMVRTLHQAPRRVQRKLEVTLGI
jgi:hypothetical protein